jgi:hypothetical protein
VYTDDFLYGSIATLLEILPSTESLVIVDGCELGHTLGKQDTHDIHFSQEEQTLYIQTFIEKHFKSQKHRIVIKKLSQDH